MHKLMIYITMGVAVVIGLPACEDDEMTEFASYEEALTALAQDEMLVTIFMDDVRNTLDLANTFDGSGIGISPMFGKAAGAAKPGSTSSFFFSDASGYWNWDTTFSWTWDTTQSFLGGMEFSGHLRFTPRGPTGLPIATTELMEYQQTSSLDVDDPEYGRFYMMLTSEYDVSGISAYRDLTGPATASGNTSFDVHVSFNDSEYGDVNFIYDFSQDVKELIVAGNGAYPTSGVIELTARSESSGMPGVKSYYVNGRISFDGTRFPSFIFGGYTFHLDLDNGTIVELTGPGKKSLFHK